ncbi:hypothetical protein Tco_1210487 [Tanacetum coccineum]
MHLRQNCPSLTINIGLDKGQPTARVSATKIREINLVIESKRLSTPLSPSELLLPLDLDRSPSFKAAINSFIVSIASNSRKCSQMEWEIGSVGLLLSLFRVCTMLSLYLPSFNEVLPKSKNDMPLPDK